MLGCMLAIKTTNNYVNLKILSHGNSHILKKEIWHESIALWENPYFDIEKIM